jgi:cytochrome c-type biogenesis protein
VRDLERELGKDVTFIVADVRLSQSAWLLTQFEVRQIPHYVMVSESGDARVSPPRVMSREELRDFILGGVETGESNRIARLLAEGSLWVFALIFFAGVITSVSPCLLAMAPVVAAYAGAGEDGRGRGLLLSAAMVLGLSTSFAILGAIAVSMGRVFGSIGRFWPVMLGAILIAAGLHYVKLMDLSVPGLKRLPVRGRGVGGAYLVGMFMGLAASPCATGVLVVILAFAGASGKVGLGALLLFVYGLGHGIPLVGLGAAVSRFRVSRLSGRYWDSFAYVLGLIFVAIGTYVLLGAL